MLGSVCSWTKGIHRITTKITFRLDKQRNKDPETHRGSQAKALAEHHVAPSSGELGGSTLPGHKYLHLPPSKAASSPTSLAAPRYCPAGALLPSGRNATSASPSPSSRSRPPVGKCCSVSRCSTCVLCNAEIAKRPSFVCLSFCCY